MDYQPIDSGISNLSNDPLRLSSDVRQNLGEAAKWAKIVSIVQIVMLSFITLGILMMFAFGATAMMGNAQAAPMFGFMLIFFVPFLGIAFWLTISLLQFASKTQTALRENDQTSLETGISKLKTFWKISGILVLIVVAFYLVAIFSGIGAGLTRSF